MKSVLSNLLLFVAPSLLAVPMNDMPNMPNMPKMPPNMPNMPMPTVPTVNMPSMLNMPMVPSAMAQDVLGRLQKEIYRVNPNAKKYETDPKELLQILDDPKWPEMVSAAKSVVLEEVKKVTSLLGSEVFKELKEYGLENAEDVLAIAEGIFNGLEKFTNQDLKRINDIINLLSQLQSNQVMNKIGMVAVQKFDEKYLKKVIRQDLAILRKGDLVSSAELFAAEFVTLIDDTLKSSRVQLSAEEKKACEKLVSESSNLGIHPKTSGFPVWAIALVSVGGIALVVAGGFFVMKRRKIVQ